MSNHEELTLEEQVEKIRRKRSPHRDYSKLQKTLNAAFLLLAAVGLVWYFTTDANRLPALGLVAAGMLLKVVEFFIRFMG